VALFTREFIRDNGDKVEVDGAYRIEDDVVEITDYKAWLWKYRNDVNGPTLDLTDAEVERLSEEITADPATWEYDYYD
jgi:hypothetical protein